MRLSPSIALCLLPFTLASSSSPQSSFESPPTSKATTIIDVLSADKDYTSLLKLLQRSLLVPTINKLNGSTLFAPTNEAIDKHSFWQDAYLTRAPRNDTLRQELLYHLLNYSIPDLPTTQKPRVEQTLHFPDVQEKSPSEQPPTWLPVPGGSLGGEPQRLRLAARDGNTWAGVDAFGNGGAKIVKGRVEASNGVVYGIGKVLHAPPSLATVVSSQPSLEKFNQIMEPHMLELLNTTSNVTLFAPVDNAWDALEDIELQYLHTDFAKEDIIRIMNMHTVAVDRVYWSDAFHSNLTLTSRYGHDLEVKPSKDDPEKFLVSGGEIVQPDVYAANGVLHLTSSLLIPPGAIQLTAEKYLLTLNCTSFVSMLHSVGLENLINTTDSQYTILAPRDDVLKTFIATDGALPDMGSEELKRVLSYHFLPGHWPQKKLKDGMLLETLLEEKGLAGERQVLDVMVHEEKGKKLAERNIQFAGAGVIGDFLEVNNTLIYFISRPLLPPADVLEAALPNLDLSSFLAAVFSTSLAEKLKTAPKTTFLFPINNAFKRLGLLVSAHLLSSAYKSDLEGVILHHVLDGVQYSKSLVEGSQPTYSTLEGSDVRLTRSKNGSVGVSASGGWPGLQGELKATNILTQTGVFHEVSDILLPRSVNLTLGKLVKAGKGSTMASLVVRAGMEWLLNGTAAPEGSSWAELGGAGADWTLLCPTDEAFKELNLTELYEDEIFIKQIVFQHLIITETPETYASSPSSNLPLVLRDAAAYLTLQSNLSDWGDVIFRAEKGEEGSGFSVGIKDAGSRGKKDWARVLAWGRSTTGAGTGGVIQIDNVLLPYHPPWWLGTGAPISVGIVGVVLIGLFFLGVRAVWRLDTTEATYEPVGGFGDEES